jgi:hypothetical protein
MSSSAFSGAHLTTLSSNLSFDHLASNRRSSKICLNASPVTVHHATVLLLHYALDNSMPPASRLLPFRPSLHGHSSSAQLSLESLQTAPSTPTTKILNILGLQSDFDRSQYVYQSHRLVQVLCILYYIFIIHVYTSSLHENNFYKNYLSDHLSI